ncbi:MAG: lytic transglycosylase domain-containing protein [Chitinophagaceae bacterium]
MQKLLLLTLVGLGFTIGITAQTQIASEITGPSSDSTLLKYHPVKSSTPDTKKAIANPAYEFNNLYEFNGIGVITSSGPKLNPRAVSFVEDYIGKNGKNLTKMKQWGKPFFDMMDGVFLQNNLPRELKYIAVIESRLNPVSVSWAGAVGPWQFMPATAIRMGLKVGRSIDERTNYIKSTKAAAKYLTELYHQFGDWLLVIAAYNGGPGNVLKAIKKSKSRNFWDIQYHLPTESRNHVKKFIGTHYIFEGQGGLTTLTRAESNDHYGANGSSLHRNIDEEEAADAKDLTVTGKYHSLIIAKNIVMDIAEFNRYNPGFDKAMGSSSNSYELKLPSDKMEMFLSHKYQILSESIQLLLSNAAPVSEVSLKLKNTL